MSGAARNPASLWREAVLRSPAYLSLLNGEDEQFWEQHSGTYARNRVSGSHFGQVVHWLAERLPPDASALEIGPGPGIFTRFLAEQCAQVTAVEPSSANAVQLRLGLSDCVNLTVLEQKWEEAAAAPHDAVFSAGTLYVFPEIETALRKMLAHARAKVLLVTMDDEQLLEKEAAAALNLPFTPHPPLTALLKEVLWQMSVPFDCASFSEEAEYLYPHLDVLADLWRGTLDLPKECLADLRRFFKARGLQDDDDAVRVPRRFTTQMFEITV